MTRLNISLFAALSAALTGCVVVPADPGPVNNPPPAEVNYAPEVTRGEAGCYWDDYNGDYIWYFQGEADDPNGVYDVVHFWADVYDNYTGQIVDSFELYPTNDPYTWYSDWLGRSTYLSCTYYDYSVDLVAYDAADAYGVLTVAPIYQ